MVVAGQAVFILRRKSVWFFIFRIKLTTLFNFNRIWFIISRNSGLFPLFFFSKPVECELKSSFSASFFLISYLIKFDSLPG